MYKLSIENEISAGHVLRDYDGPCSRPHGHNWKIRAVVKTDKLAKNGIAIDFSDMQKIVWQVIGKFDHNNFNDIEPFTKTNPTAENIVRYFYDQIKKLLPAHIFLQEVILWETEKYQVTYSE